MNIIKRNNVILKNTLIIFFILISLSGCSIHNWLNSCATLQDKKYNKHHCQLGLFQPNLYFNKITLKSKYYYCEANIISESIKNDTIYVMEVDKSGNILDTLCNNIDKDKNQEYKFKIFKKNRIVVQSSFEKEASWIEFK